MQILIIMQGVQGSGKSYLVKKLIAGQPNMVVCSTDAYHYIGKSYHFSPEHLAYFHEMNLVQAKRAMNSGYSVVVDNTNIKAFHCLEYVKYAIDKGIEVQFIRVEGNFGNSHGVPQEKVEKMRAEMETLTLQSVLNSVCPRENEEMQ